MPGFKLQVRFNVYNNSIFTNIEHCVETNIHSDMDLPLLLVTSLDVSFLHLELAPKSLISKNYPISKCVHVQNSLQVSSLLSCVC